jgi:hypothetical protein
MAQPWAIRKLFPRNFRTPEKTDNASVSRQNSYRAAF